VDPNPDLDPAIFVIKLFKTPTKNYGNKKKFFCGLHHFLKIKKQKEVTKKQNSKFFLLFLLDFRRIRIYTSDWIRILIQEAQKYVDPVDPEHWF
jgi:hypothetical protein